MPVILDYGSEEMRTWLDPTRKTWSKELQSILKPYEGELECYPVSKEVGKVGNNSPDFIIPVNSKENKSNIANFFANAKAKDVSPKKEPGIKAEGDEDKKDIAAHGTKESMCQNQRALIMRPRNKRCINAHSRSRRKNPKRVAQPTIRR